MPLVRIRGKGHAQFEGPIDLGLAVAPHEAIERAADKFRRVARAPAPIVRVRNAQFDHDASEACGRCIAAEGPVMKSDSIKPWYPQTRSSCDQPGGTRPAGALVADLFRL